MSQFQLTHTYDLQGRDGWAQRLQSGYNLVTRYYKKIRPRQADLSQSGTRRGPILRMPLHASTAVYLYSAHLGGGPWHLNKEDGALLVFYRLGACGLATASACPSAEVSPATCIPPPLGVGLRLGEDDALPFLRRRSNVLSDPRIPPGSALGSWRFGRSPLGHLYITIL